MRNRLFLLLFLIGYSSTIYSQDITIISVSSMLMNTPFDITPENFDKGYIRNALDTIDVNNEADKISLINTIKNMKEDNDVISFDTRGKILIQEHGEDKILYFSRFYLKNGSKYYIIDSSFEQLIDRIFYNRKKIRPFYKW